MATTTYTTCHLCGGCGDHLPCCSKSEHAKRYACPDCNGGTTYRSQDCPTCGGNGKLTERELAKA